MTLILTVANSRGVHQSSDYQLTHRDSGMPISDEAGTKQVEATFGRLHLQLAFTGIAMVGEGSAARRTVDWLSAELKALPLDYSLHNICTSLARRCAAAMRPHGRRGVLTLVLAVATVAKPFRVAVISNARWGERPPQAKAEFNIQIHTAKKPLHLISGYRECVPLAEKFRLKALARSVDKVPQEVSDTLADINAIAARNSGGYVSDGCWVSSQIADGRIRRTSMRNVGGQSGSVRQLFAGMDILEWIKANFRATPGKEIRIEPIGGALYGPGDAVKLPPPRGRAATRRAVRIVSHFPAAVSVRARLCVNRSQSIGLHH